MRARIAHLPDVGGRPLSPDATDIFEEGIRFPILKLHKARGAEPGRARHHRGERAAADRGPGRPRQHGGGERRHGARALKFLDEYGLDEVDELADAIHARSEAQMRKAIRAWPNGTYRAETILDGFDSEVKLAVAVTVNDETVHVDYAGSSGQVHARHQRAHQLPLRPQRLRAEMPARPGDAEQRGLHHCRSPTRRRSAPSSTPTPRRPATPATSSGTSSRA